MGEHLGIIVDFKEGTLSVTPARVQKFKAVLTSVMEIDFSTARFVPKVVGIIISMDLGFGPVLRMGLVCHIWILLKLLFGMLEFFF